VSNLYSLRSVVQEAYEVVLQSKGKDVQTNAHNITERRERNRERGKDVMLGLLT
jgi:hypothetical protein